MIMGDFNAKVGKGRVKDVVRNHGLRVRNKREDRLVQYYQEKELVVANIFYLLHPRRLYTWIAPGDNENNLVRNHTDYVLIK